MTRCSWPRRSGLSPPQSSKFIELAAAPSGITRVYVVENEITYLAFPLSEGAMVIFGAGYAVSILEPLGWLAGVDLVY